jgi:hypothetical protein
MACKHWHERGWRQAFARIPHQNGVPWFPTIPKDEQHALVDQIEEWFKTDEAKGFYVCSTTWPPDAEMETDEHGRKHCHSDKIGHTWFFTDPNTALAFKLRFM